MRFARFIPWSLDTPKKNRPATIVLNIEPMNGKGPKIILTSEMRDALVALNNDKNGKGGEKIYRDLLERGSGYVNFDADDDINKRKPVCVGFSGNVGNVIGETQNFFRIECFNYQDVIHIAKTNFQDTPWMIGKFTSVDKRGYLYKLGRGKNAYIPNISMGSELWVHKKYLEFFPPLGVVTPRLWGGISVREEPSYNSHTIYPVPKDIPLRTTEYFPRGSEVWASIEGGGYICLYWPHYRELMPFTSRQTTSWMMKTPPPPI